MKLSTAMLPLLSLLLCVTAIAAESKSSKLIRSMEGVYKHQFTNGYRTAAGLPDETFEDEDVVEVVRHGNRHIYVRAELKFYNTHRCSIFGIASYEKGKFIYRPKGWGSGKQCTLSISVEGKALRLDDSPSSDNQNSCRWACGMRGSLSDYTIPMSHNRQIR